MAETQRLGLEMFGGFAGGALGDRDYKFSTRDRQIVDAFLAALEGHRHTGGSPLADATVAPGLTLNPGGTAGVLPGGASYFYTVSYVDEWGLETAMSHEASISTPAPIATPPAPAVTPRTGGTLQAGTYYYQITFRQSGSSGETLETLPSPTTVVTVAGANHTARVSLPPLPAGADGWVIYRLGQNDPYSFAIIGLTNPALTHWDDTGVLSPDSFSTTPLENTTNSQNTVQIDIPDPGLLTDPVTAGQIRRWRIYRTDTSGDYPDTSLVHEVVETVHETAPYGALVSSWVDTGTPLLAGSPLLVSTTFNPPESASVAPSAGASDYTPTAPLTATNVQDALDQVAARLAVDQPRIEVTLAAADGLTANNWGVAAVSGLGWVVPPEFDGWIVENFSAGLATALTAGEVHVFLQWSDQGGAFQPCDNPVDILTGTNPQRGVQATPYAFLTRTVRSGDVLLATTSVVSTPTPANAGAMLAVALRHP